MNSRLKSPEDLWTIYNLPTPNDCNDFIHNLGFTLLDRNENLIAYKGEQEVVIVFLEDNLITRVKYSTTDPTNYLACTSYAKEELGFILISKEYRPLMNLLQLDNDEYSLICMTSHSVEISYHTYGVTLLAKLPIPTNENIVSVTITAPPPLPIIG